MLVVWITAGILAALIALVGLGFVIRPRALRSVHAARDLGEVVLPADLPEPVRRHYAASIGSRIPRVDTLALWGRARMRRGFLRLPVTFWSEHHVGRSGVQLLAVTWCGLPILRGRDSYVNGHGEMVIAGKRTDGPEIDQGENLFVWSELVLAPSTLVTCAGVRWEHIDDTTARLIVPFGDSDDELVFSFDPETGLIRHARAMRYKTPGAPKVGWRLEYLNWRRYDDGIFPSRFTVTWEDEQHPWFILDVDGVAFNIPTEKSPEGAKSTSKE